VEISGAGNVYSFHNLYASDARRGMCQHLHYVYVYVFKSFIHSDITKFFQCYDNVGYKSFGLSLGILASFNITAINLTLKYFHGK